MSDFLLELRSEEIPARMQAKAKDDLARLFGEAMAKAGLMAADIETFATPRRLALIAKGLPDATEATADETRGPKVGAPPQALEGFLRKTGLTQDQLTERDGVYFAVVEKPGRKTADVLAEAIPAIVRAFPWPKSMRWGAASLSTESLRWVRPLQGIVAIFGQDLVPCEVDGVQSGVQTLGHRFHHSGPVTIGGADDYVETLRAARVIVHFSERCAIIRDGAVKAAADAGLVLVEDEGLVTENAGLTEWPVPMLGRFDPAFLAVPEEVIQLTARVNQKYFVCHDAAGSLANAFVCTANIVAKDGGTAIVAGNEKVLAARLSDAKFFWEQDLKIRLEDQAKKLSSIVFHEKLGTVADKVDRVARLARWLVEEGIVTDKPLPFRGGVGVGAVRPSDTTGTRPHPPTPSPSPEGEGLDLADLAERAARLCKADLVTGMVGEFPELQGIMGGYYARAQGEDDAVSDAIRDHYKPVGQGDEVPTAPVTVAVSLADKLDTLASFFSVGHYPTGSRDPFALRRAGMGIIELLLKENLRLSFSHLGKIVAVRLALVVEEHWQVPLRLAGFDIAWLEYQESQFPIQRSADGDLFRERMGGIGVEWLKDSHTPDALEFFTILFDRYEANLELGLDVFSFLADRLKVQQREAGVRHDLIDAVFALGKEDDLVRLLARVKALQGFVGTNEGANLLAAYKRAANILKQAGDNEPLPFRGGVGVGSVSHSLFAEGHADSPLPNPSPEGEGLESRALLTALDTAQPAAQAAIAAEDFEAAMSALASLRAPIDAFFEGVMVNDPDPQKRAYRMGLLERFRDAVTQVADFSKIEG